MGVAHGQAIRREREQIAAIGLGQAADAPQRPVDASVEILPVASDHQPRNFGHRLFQIEVMAQFGFGGLQIGDIEMIGDDMGDLAIGVLDGKGG